MGLSFKRAARHWSTDSRFSFISVDIKWTRPQCARMWGIRILHYSQSFHTLFSAHSTLEFAFDRNNFKKCVKNIIIIVLLFSLTQFVAASIVRSIYSENNEVRWKRAKNSFADYKFKTFLFNKRFFWKNFSSKHPTNRLLVLFYAKFSLFCLFFD